MSRKERRRHQRINASNLISYNCIDETNQTISQGMGRTLNISKGGILLESHVPIDPKYAVELAIGLEDDLVIIKGRIVFSIAGKEERFEAGIEFIEIDETQIEVLNKYIKAFREQ